MSDITQALQAAENGEAGATDRLLDLVYGELRRIASARMTHERPGQTLQPTALVHEAWLSLGGDAQPGWRNRAHFFGAASEAMRRILIDRARRRLAQRRGAGKEHVALDGLELAAPHTDEHVLAVDEALTRLAVEHPRKAELVRLRYYVGLTNEEVARTMGISEPTAKRWWAYARAWLHRELAS